MLYNSANCLQAEQPMSFVEMAVKKRLVRVVRRHLLRREAIMVAESKSHTTNHGT